MQRNGTKFVYSASDLNNFIECPHITELDKLVMAGALERPQRSDRVDIIAKYGDLHEQSYLDSIRAGGHEIVAIERMYGEDGWIEGARQTESAMAAGKPYIAQATFFDGTWVGYADLIRRVETACPRWAWSYEAVDAKLARAEKPYFVLQLCNYTEQLHRLQGVAPREMCLYLGSHQERGYRYADFESFYRRVKARFLRAVAADTDTYPYVIPFCTMCKFDALCAQRRIDDDHPSLVQFARRDQVERLIGGAPPISTIAALAVAPDDARPEDMARSTFDRLRRQAAVQVRSRNAGSPAYELLPIAVERGLSIIPPPSEGDVFFDMEGDPFAEGGLEYLFGYVTVDAGSPQFFELWADDLAAEKEAFERFIDFVSERRAHWPDLHVYHYAPYEPSALKRLMVKHMTREQELDELLRGEVFVDLYAAVRQGMLVPAYSIKDLEAFYWQQGRKGEVTTAIDSVLTFERWRHEHRQQDKDDILAYNRLDCESTLALRDWLLQRRDEAYERFGPPEPIAREQRPPARPETVDFRRRQERIAHELEELVKPDPAAVNAEVDPLTLLSHLMYYHRREAKPVWWEFFERIAQTPEELVEDGTAIGGLRPADGDGPTTSKRSLVYRFTYPPQQHKIDEGDGVYDGYGERAGTVVFLDDAAAILWLRRGKPLPPYPPLRALIPAENYSTMTIEVALCDFADAELSAQRGGADRFRAGRSVLFREAPRVRGREAGTPLQHGDIGLDQIKAICRALDDSHLFIQGPPGSGKTYTGARLAVDLMQQGKRIAVSANSHKAIHNMLHEIEKVADECGYRFSGVKKGDGEEKAFASKLEQPMIANATKTDECLLDSEQLVAGTAWLFADLRLRERFEYLFIDEAGQVALANALALSVVAKNLVLLGDPLQLAQVSKGAQPEGAQASVLEHLLGTYATIPPERGVFLTQSYRMHPAVCDFISQSIYDGRLHSHPRCAKQRLDAPGMQGAGLRFVPVEHDGDPVRSPEEADAVVDIVANVLTGTVTNSDGVSRPMTMDDILVVAPYNAQVRLIRDAFVKRGLDARRVGTVDKFQGQEAPVVLYSMTSPSAADVPHGVEFLFSQNRLNVAISRAMCWSVIVASPRLLDANCRTVDQMRLVNTLCRFVESAT